MSAKYVDRPKLIGERLANHFDNANPQAKRLWTLVIQLSNFQADHAAALVKEAGITISRGEIMILTCLRLSMAPYELRQSEISERVLMTSGGVTNICKKLVANDWISKEKDPDDARGTIYRLTEQGTDVADTVIPIIHSAEKNLVSCMDADELENLCELLERATRQVNRTER